MQSSREVRPGDVTSDQCCSRAWEIAMGSASTPPALFVTQPSYLRACTPPPPPCISYALVQATVGVGTVLIWDLILIRYQT